MHLGERWLLVMQPRPNRSEPQPQRAISYILSIASVKETCGKHESEKDPTYETEVLVRWTNTYVGLRLRLTSKDNHVLKNL